MAKKKKAVRKSAKSAPTQDQIYVEEAYKEELKSQANLFFSNVAINDPNAENLFRTSLGLLRKARALALDLVK